MTEQGVAALRQKADEAELEFLIVKQQYDDLVIFFRSSWNSFSRARINYLAASEGAEERGWRLSDKPKSVLAHELNDRAKALDKATEQNPMELGAIAYAISNDRELLAELGFGSVKEWGEKTFQKRWKSIQNLAKVYAKLHVECGWETADIVGIGTVKANLLARLPESEIRKEEWSKAAKESNTSDFKQKVKSFLGTSPDHREGFCKVSFDSPISFRDDTWRPTIAKGMASEGTEETYVVVEAALANYAIELQNEDVRCDVSVNLSDISDVPTDHYPQGQRAALLQAIGDSLDLGLTETPAGEDAAPDPIDYGIDDDQYKDFVPDTPEAGSSESQAGASPTTP